MSHVIIHTDGACKGNPGPGGWGALLQTGGGHEKELWGGEANTTPVSDDGEVASASMSGHMKDLAKRFFLLLHVVLERRYKRVELVFIRHTETAEEEDEQTYFTDPRSGGSG